MKKIYIFLAFMLFSSNVFAGEVQEKLIKCDCENKSAEIKEIENPQNYIKHKVDGIISYKGQTLKELADGFGILETKDFIYEGCFKNGSENGKGIINYKKRENVNTYESYEGEFENGLYKKGTYYKYAYESPIDKFNKENTGRFEVEKFEGEFENGLYKKGKYSVYNNNNRKKLEKVFNGEFEKGIFKKGKALYYSIPSYNSFEDQVLNKLEEGDFIEDKYPIERGKYFELVNGLRTTFYDEKEERFKITNGEKEELIFKINEEDKKIKVILPFSKKELNSTKKEYEDSLEQKNIIVPFANLAWNNANFSEITKLLFDSGIENIEVFSGGCLSKDSIQILNTLFDGSLEGLDKNSIVNKFIKEDNKKKPCSFKINKIMSSQEIINKISEIDIKVEEEKFKLLKNLAKAQNIPFNKNFKPKQSEIYHILYKKHFKVLDVSKKLEFKAEPVIIANEPFKLTIEFEFNPMLFIGNEIILDKRGNSYAYLIKSITLESLNKSILKENYDTILNKFKEKYSNFYKELAYIKHFEDPIGNTIYINEKSINYSSGFFEFIVPFYWNKLAELEKQKQKEIDKHKYQGKKDQKNSL